MKTKDFLLIIASAFFVIMSSAYCQIGTRFPSERKVVKDPVTGTELIFLTSKPAGDSKIYPTHPQWTADGKWLIFRSNKVKGETMAVNEETGDLVQISEGGYTGMLNIAPESMKLYFMRPVGDNSNRGQDRRNRNCSLQVIETDRAKTFKDSEAGTSGHKTTAADHLHPTFKPDGRKIQIQSAMLSEDDRSMNIVIVPVPDSWLDRTYPDYVEGN